MSEQSGDERDGAPRPRRYGVALNSENTLCIGASLDIQICNEEGEPVTGLPIEVEVEREPTYYELTDANGELEISQLPPDLVTVRIRSRVK